jgi:hypothetical protein
MACRTGTFMPTDVTHVPRDIVRSSKYNGVHGLNSNIGRLLSPIAHFKWNAFVT